MHYLDQMKLQEIEELIQEKMYTNIKNPIKLLEIKWNRRPSAQRFRLTLPGSGFVSDGL